MPFQKHLLTLHFVLIAISAAISQHWSPVGTGANGAVRALVPLAEGIAIGGDFTQFNHFDRVHLAFAVEHPDLSVSVHGRYSEKFNWDTTGSIFGTRIQALCAAGERLYVGGFFTHNEYPGLVSAGYFEPDHEGGAAVFNTFSSNPGTDAVVCAAVATDSMVVFGGLWSYWNGSQNLAYVPVSHDSSPLPMPLGSALNGKVNCLALHNDTLYAGGHFTASDSTPLWHMAKWSGSAWMPVAGGFDGPVHALVSHAGSLYAGGAFQYSDSLWVSPVAVLTDSGWRSVASGLSDTADSVFALCVHDDTLYAAGHFADSLNAFGNICKQNDSLWAPLGAGTNGPVFALTTYRGRLYAGGAFTKAGEAVAQNIGAYTRKPVTKEVAEIDPSRSWVVYPNPASTHVVATSGLEVAGEAVLSDLAGRPLHRLALNGPELRFSVSALPAGVYFLQLPLAGQGVYVAKILVTHP